MEILEADPDFFDMGFPNRKHVYNGADFNELNKDKVESVKYLIFTRKNKNIVGLIGGIANGKFSSPFSAPFGGWSYNKDMSLTTLGEAHELLENYLAKQNIRYIKIVLPPLFYDETALSLMFNIAYRRSYSLANVDLNYQFNLDNFNADYISWVSYNARRNFKIAEESNLTVEKVTSQADIKKAYDIIAQNRAERGFPLKMTFESVQDTIKIVPADFFIVYTKDKVAAASAMLFHVNKEVVQVVYWGHIGEFSPIKPINYLSYHLFDYYKKAGFKYVDIGPSTDGSEPNYGLIEFKDSIGCSVSPKLTFEKKLS